MAQRKVYLPQDDKTTPENVPYNFHESIVKDVSVSECVRIGGGVGGRGGGRKV